MVGSHPKTTETLHRRTPLHQRHGTVNSKEEHKPPPPPPPQTSTTNAISFYRFEKALEVKNHNIILFNNLKLF